MGIMDDEDGFDIADNDGDDVLREIPSSSGGPMELQPLPKPQSLLSRVDWSQREPEWYDEESAKESHRVARKYLGKLYKEVQQEKLGVVLYQTVQPWPPYLPGPDKGPEPKPVPRRIYDKAPFVLKVGRDPPKTPVCNDPLKVPQQLVRRKRDIQEKLHDFGRAVGGAPYRFDQTCSRVEAKSMYRKHKWQLAKNQSGPLGPMEAIGFDYAPGKSQVMTSPLSMLASTGGSQTTDRGTFDFMKKKSGTMMSSCSLPALPASPYLQ